MIAETGQPLKKSLKRFNKKSGNDQFQEPLTLTLNGCICLSLNNISLPFTYSFHWEHDKQLHSNLVGAFLNKSTNDVHRFNYYVNYY